MMKTGNNDISLLNTFLCLRSRDLLWYKILFYLLVLFFSFISFTNNAFSQTHSSAEFDFSPIQNKIEGWIDSDYYKGASVIIVKNNKVLYEKYFGTYQPQTVAYIASAGKWLAAATIAALVDEGKLKWTDKVRKWIPQFKDVKGDATLQQLLSHTSGYPDYQPEGRQRDDYQTLKESVAHIVDLPADTIPGAVFYYGGLAMQVAGRMAEIATGKNWETIFQQKIAAPLHMTLTHFTPVDTPGHGPMLGGGARTSLHDYANFLNLIYNNGVFNGKRILSEKAIAAMQANHVGNADITLPGGGARYVNQVRNDTHHGVYGLA